MGWSAGQLLKMGRWAPLLQCDILYLRVWFSSLDAAYGVCRKEKLKWRMKNKKTNNDEDDTT